MKVDPQLLQQLSRTQGAQKSQKDSIELVPEPYRDVAQGMEEQFLEFMIQQMKNSIDRSEDSSTAMDYYESLLTEQQSQSMASQGGGVGIQRLILDQIYPDYMRTEGNYRSFSNQQQAHNSYKKAGELAPQGPQNKGVTNE